MDHKTPHDRIAPLISCGDTYLTGEDYLKEQRVADYNLEMFQKDHNEILPKLLTGTVLKEPAESEKTEEPTGADIINLFIEKYGKARGRDYSMRFLSVMQFIDHYQKDLQRNGLIEDNPGAMQVKGELLQFLLESFRPPQPPGIMPSSPLLNQDHEINFKKVIRALKGAARD
jgi:hypothetical protein